MDKLPTFVELAEYKLACAEKRDKIINIKISIGTARMMVKAEKKNFPIIEPDPARDCHKSEDGQHKPHFGHAQTEWDGINFYIDFDCGLCKRGGSICIGEQQWDQVCWQE